MMTALALSLAVWTAPAPARAEPPAAVSTAAAAGLDADHQPNADMASGISPYAAQDFEDVTKADLKQMEADLKATLALLNASFAAEKELEERHLKEKIAFLKDAREERAAFEKAQIGEWKKFVERLRAAEPAERGADKIVFDRSSDEARVKFNEAALAKSRDFLDQQNREREAFRVKQQKENGERARVQQEHSTKWGKPSNIR